MPLPLSAGEPREPGKALSKTSLAPKRRAISAACLTASSAVADPSVPTATVEIIRAQYLADRAREASDVLRRHRLLPQLSDFVGLPAGDDLNQASAGVVT